MRDAVAAKLCDRMPLMLEAAGQDTTQARALLATFEATQANRERGLAMLLHDLAQRGWKLGFP